MIVRISEHLNRTGNERRRKHDYLCYTFKIGFQLPLTYHAIRPYAFLRAFGHPFKLPPARRTAVARDARVPQPLSLFPCACSYRSCSQMPPARRKPSKRHIPDSLRESTIERVMVLLRKTTMLAELIAPWNDGGDAGKAVYDDACAQYYNNPDKVRQCAPYTSTSAQSS
jgi:hypothetical protein